MENNIYKKLFLVRQEVGNITKNQKNPFYNNNYADLNQIIDHINPILNKHDLLLLQPLNDNKVFTNIIDIKSEKQVQSSLDLPNDLSPQKIGSAISYYRRYTLLSLLSLLSEDDDGNLTDKRPEINQETLALLKNSIAKNPDQKEQLIKRASGKFKIRQDVLNTLN